MSIMFFETMQTQFEQVIFSFIKIRLFKI